MLVSLTPPDWSKECEAIHHLVQDILRHISQEQQFSRKTFDADPGRHAFTGQRTNTATMVPHLTAACSVERGEKVDFADAHSSDRSYSCGAKFRFSHRERNKPWDGKLVKLMEQTYDSVLVKRGFRNLPGFPSTHVVGRRQLIQKFLAANETLGCCPYCGADLVLSNCKLDHFFPKSKYPTLALVLSNLVPSCGDCNSLYKGEIDPLDGVVCDHEIEEVCLPYHADLHSFFVPVIDKGADGTHLLDLAIPDTVPARSRNQVIRFLAFTRLRDHWTLVLPHIRKIMAPAELKVCRQMGRVNNVDEVAERLLDLADLHAQSHGGGGYAFLKSHYYPFLAQQAGIVADYWEDLRLIRPSLRTRA